MTAMLLYKAWCETRVRFVIALAALAASFAIPGDGPQTMFILLAITLGGGSPRQEQALGTAGFTLALPVTRTRLILARAAGGAAEVLVLALLVAAFTRAPDAVLRWGVCGLVVFAAALACATLIASEYVAWLAAFTAVMGYEALINLTGVPGVDLYETMRLGGPAPLGDLAILVAAAAVLIGGAALHLRRRDL